ncbi:inosine/xanthosine triphosphatase [Bacillus sp. OV322]|uniref:DUF84 family protein n=1 Tax=Bacillus sp. OV322 TaxID=1882764 RepID=UPI0008E689CC|nr:DUF84 family protein [Bacillus sp. OV322]SFC58512.1 inosine/xanthosine triphosphatase [Bacillus sp. OV322]
MLKVAVGSKNPAKVKAVEKAYENIDIEIISLDAASGVAAQPFSDEETIEGAINRAKASRDHSGASIGIGLEGGVVQTKYGLFVCNWGAMAVGQEVFLAGGARILLPEKIAERLKEGAELGPLMDEYTKRPDIRKKEGAIGVFTNERLSRSEMFEQIACMLIGQYECKYT